MAAAATAAGEARAITNSFQGQLASMHQDMQSLQTKVLLVHTWHPAHTVPSLRLSFGALAHKGATCRAMAPRADEVLCVFESHLACAADDTSLPCLAHNELASFKITTVMAASKITVNKADSFKTTIGMMFLACVVQVDTALASVECANEDMKKCASAVDDLAHKVNADTS